MLWYSFMVALEDLQTQQRGITAIVFAVGDSLRRPVDTQTFLQLPKLINAIPATLCGILFLLRR